MERFIVLVQFVGPATSATIAPRVGETRDDKILYAIIILGLLTFIIFLIALLYSFSTRMRRFSSEQGSLGAALLEVRLPKKNEIEINAADQMFSSIYGMGKPKGIIGRLFKSSPSVSFEIVALPESIRFYVHVPLKVRSLVEKQIHAAYPSADISECEEYNIFSENGQVTFASLTLASENYKPVRTYSDLATDSLSNITNAMSKLQDGEGAVLQIIITPAGKKWRKKGKSYINGMKAASTDENKKVTIQEDILSAVEKKCSKEGFKADIRVVSVAPTEARSERNMKNITGAFDIFTNPGINEFNKLKMKAWDLRKFAKDFIYRIPKGACVLNTEELASIFHFPNKNIETPHIHWLLSKRAPAAEEIPTQGLWLGTSVYRGVSREVCIKENDRRRHMYIVGKTGSGKSFFLQSMIIQDILDGKGVAFLDPHGDAAEWVIERIPPERAEDVIYFNPADVERPIGFNVIQFLDEQDKHRIVNSFIGLMYKMFDPNRQGIVGPRFERAVRNAMLTAMSEDGNTLVEVMRILTDPQFVKQKLPLINDDLVRRYWTDEIAQTSDFHKSEVLGYIVSKFDRFVTNKLMRNIVGQSKSGFDLRKIMDDQKILIVNLSKGLVGEENTQFLGLLLVPKILSAAMSRADVAEEERKDFYLYVDEFQNFATEDFAQILSEARKYRLNLIVANQYITQIDEKIREAVFGNVGSIISFKVGVNDAQYLQNEFAPVFDQNDLINLENVNAYVKMLVNGEYPPPFSMATWFSSQKYPYNEETARTIKHLSRLRYGRERSIVETEIVQRAQLKSQPTMTQGGMGGMSPFGGGVGGFNPPALPNYPSGLK